MDYPADWEIKKLGEIGEWESGSTPSRNNPAYYKNGKIFWVKNTDLNDDFLKSSEEKITEQALKENFLKIKKPGTILIAMYCGETVGKLSILDVNATTNQNCCACELYNGFYNKFVFYSLLFRRKEIQGLSLFGGLAHISKRIITNYSIPLSPLAEQKAIADTLGTFDAHIKNLSELIEKKKAIRDGALEDLMSGRKRLKGFNGDWKVKKLGELCKIIRGASPRPIETYITHNVNGVNWIKISDAPKYGKYITHTEEKITQSGAIHSVFVKVGDLILSNSMSFGRPYILRISGYIHDGWLRLYDYKNFDKDYLCYALSSKEVYKQYVTFAAGSGVQNLNKNVVKNVTIPLPPLAEQKAIAETLTALDDEITALEAERDKIIQIRDGAMDDLLTGKVRLKF